jgi:hypothetical protein
MATRLTLTVTFRSVCWWTPRSSRDSFELVEVSTPTKLNPEASAPIQFYRVAV